MPDDWDAARGETFAAFVRESMSDEPYKEVAAAAGMGENTLRNWARNKLKTGPQAANVKSWARVIGVDQEAALTAAGISAPSECPPPQELPINELVRRAELRYRLLGQDLGELRRRLGQSQE